MSAFDRSLRVFPVSAVLLSGILAGIAGSDTDSVSAQESPVTGSSFSTATSVHDDKRVMNAVLQNSTSEARTLGEPQRGWTAAHGKASRDNDVVSLQSADARRGGSVAKSRRSKPATVPTPRPVILASASRPVIPPVPEPVRENTGPEDLEAVELAPVEPSPAPEQSASETSGIEGPSLEPSAADAIPGQPPAATVTPPPTAKSPASLQGASDQPILTATERFKLALEEEQRRALAEQAAANEETPVLPSLDEGPVDLAPVEDMPPERLPSPYGPQEPSEIAIDDPEMRLLDERARRFVRLKQQLMQLKSQLEQPAATDASEPQPPSADVLHSDPQKSHTAPDKESRLDGHSEELLPPVDEHESPETQHPETQHPETEDHATDHGGHGPEPHDTSGHSDLADAVAEHPATPPGHGQENGEHESDVHAGEPSTSEDGHQTKNSHGESGASEHFGTESATHAASEHAVVHGPIDRLGLANNLYAVGEYQLAMKMYEQTEMAELTAQQQIWTDYQMANCLRRMGRNAEASNRYRRIAEQPEAGWLSEQSRWWVDVLEQIRQFQSSLEEDAEAPKENLQSPFAGVPRDRNSSDNATGQSGLKKSGSAKSGSTKSGKGSHPSGSNNDAEHGSSAASSSSRTSSRAGKPARERITYFAPAKMEAKHGKH